MTAEQDVDAIAHIRRGQVWTGNLNPCRGQEVGKIRPVLVIQGDWLSAAQDRTVVVLLSPATFAKRGNPFESLFRPATLYVKTRRSWWTSLALSTVAASARNP